MNHIVETIVKYAILALFALPAFVLAVGFAVVILPLLPIMFVANWLFQPRYELENEPNN